MSLIPYVGIKGVFDLAPPFHTATESGVEYTVKAVRKLSDWVASNENPESLIYTANGIASIYDEDVRLDAYIISLQSKSGHVLYVPERYINSYPSGNGVAYRAVAIVLTLPSIPAETPLDGLTGDMQALISAQLGISSKVALREVSRPVLISNDAHTAKQTARDALKSSRGTYADNIRLRNELARLQAKVAALEAHVQANA